MGKAPHESLRGTVRDRDFKPNAVHPIGITIAPMLQQKLLVCISVNLLIVV